MDNQMNQYDSGNRGGTPGGGNNNGNGGNNRNEPPKWPGIVTLLLVGLTVILMVVFFTNFFFGSSLEGEEVSYTQFLQYIEDGVVENVEVRSTGEVYFSLKRDETQENAGNRYPGLVPGFTFSGSLQGVSRKYCTMLMEDAGTLTARLEEHGIDGHYVPHKNSTILDILITIVLPILLMWLLLSLMFRKMGGAGGPMGVGKNNAKVYVQKETGVTFKDVAGEDEAKESLVEVVDFLHNPGKYSKIGAKLPKGALLVGPPGTGKTLLAKAVAGEAHVPFFSLTGSDFIELYVGVGASRVRDLFKEANKNAPCIIFIDEIDAIGRSRDSKYGGGNEEREQTLNQLLSEMDGFDTSKGILVLGATNRPEILDKALLRPGRFDRQVTVTNPDKKGREEILNVHVKKVPLAKDVNISVIARGTPGFSGADLANLVNEAALLAARKNKRKVTSKDFDEAKDKVLMGAEKKSMAMDEKEKTLTAYHEAGHAICSLYVEETDPIHKATIIPRGHALGMVQQLPEKDQYSYSRAKMLSRLVIMMGGRVAEELKFGYNAVTSGASSDIAAATNLARSMVTEWGMSDLLGPILYAENSGEVFLGKSVTQNKNVSEETARLVDSEIKRLVTEGHDNAKKLLQEKEKEWELLAQALIEYETLTGDEIKKVIAGEKLDKSDEGPVSEEKRTHSSVPEV